VIAVFRDWFRTYQQQGLVLPLDQYMRAARFDADDFLAPVYRALNWAGKQVGVPQYYSTRCVYYNRDLFQQAGVALPAEAWTHEQLVDAARRLTRGPMDERRVWGLTSSGAWSNPLVTIPLVWARCGDLNDPKDPNVFTPGRPENVAAFQWVHDLRWKERLAAGTNEERGGVNGFDAIFTTGSAAMHVGTTAGLGAWKDRAQTNWDIVALPSGPCGRGEQASVDGYAIPAGTKTPDASWVAVYGLTDRDANKLMAQTTGLCPGRKSQFGAWVDTIPDRSLRRALPTEATRPSPDALWPKAADVSQVVNAQLAKYFDENSVSLQGMLQQLAAGVSGVLGAGAVR
jgi:multiple sugar transport system substrate-binding protein